jgi:phage-related protein
MAVYPTLIEGGNNIYPDYPITEQFENSVIRSNFDGGYVQTRARFSRIRKQWSISYNNLTLANKLLITNFVATVNGGADSFTWVNPADSQSYSVRFQNPPISTLSSFARWNVKFVLEQV